MHIWHNIFRFFCIRKEKKIAQKHAVLQQDLKLKKMKGKWGEGTKKNSTLPTFLKTTYFQKNSSLDNVRKMFEVHPKKILLSQKYYLHTPVHIFVTTGNYSVFLQNLEAKSQISREKNVPHVLQSIFICKVAQKYLIVSRV